MFNGTFFSDIDNFSVKKRAFLNLTCSILFMAKNEQGGTLPSSQGGLVQYFDADTGIEIDPKTVIMTGVLISALEIILHSGILI